MLLTDIIIPNPFSLSNMVIQCNISLNNKTGLFYCVNSFFLSFRRHISFSYNKKRGFEIQDIEIINEHSLLGIVEEKVLEGIDAARHNRRRYGKGSSRNGTGKNQIRS